MPFFDQPRFAMRLSLAAGLVMLAGKMVAYWITGSAAILSDAAESVVHVLAVGFAAFSLWLNSMPANDRFRYGYERISFFSAGAEGTAIILAAVYILVAVVQQWIAGLELQKLGVGVWMVAAAGTVNGLLGWYLLRTGRRNGSLILEANGRHVLTDSWTSFGVVAGLILVIWTGWKPFDPLLAIAVALNILWSGAALLRRSIFGLMDYADPATSRQLGDKLDAACSELGLRYHAVRFRHTGHRLIVDLHLLLPFNTPLGQAHRLATRLEERLGQTMDLPTEVVTHLESLEDHVPDCPLGEAVASAGGGRR